RVLVREDEDHARHALHRGGVDRRDRAAGDGAADHNPVAETVERELGGVFGAAAHLRLAVDPRERLARGRGTSRQISRIGAIVHAALPASARARATLRFASSTLKALCASGFALATAAFAARSIDAAS